MSRRNRSNKKQAPGKLSEAIARIEEARKNHATALDLSRLGLIAVPESIGQLTQLQILSLNENRLTAVPDSIGQLTQLKHLRLDGNRLTAVPDSIGQLAELKGLHLYNNQLASVPDSISQLVELNELSLYDNQLTAIPDSIGQLKKLQILYLSGNQLTAVPESIGQLTRLQRLDLDSNNLTVVTDSISQLTNLHYLSLSENQLTQLPESIGQLVQLLRLDLTGNQLTAVPESMRKLESLHQLFLHGNALGLPQEILGPTPEAVFIDVDEPAKPAEILDYYFREKRPLNEAKLILVGRGKVGKTSIVNKLVYNRFDKDEKKTEGINITGWPINLHTGEAVRLNIWDFGGQEITHATHLFFLTQRSVYLLVLNGREGGEDADAEYWLKLIESFGDESPVIVVLNKIQEHPFDLNRSALQRKYPAIREFIKTDCDDGTGFDKLRETIYRETDRLAHLRDSFPATWFTIKDQLLAETKKDYLSMDEYRGFCVQHGEVAKSAQDSLAGYLHNLGIALNYKDDLRLRDTHVLNPHWVTTGIYKILNSQKLETQKGEIHQNDLLGILDESQYPRSMHRFIFDLMKKFELCFSFPNDDCHHLIPELLDKQEPDDTDKFQPDECLNFQYHYPVLPEGLLPRFIVRTHVLSEGLPRWRTGVILKFGDNRALVKADKEDKKVFISVSGPASSRRQLLAVIRSDFERIHYDIRNLKPLEMIPSPHYPNILEPYEDLLVMEQNVIKTITRVADGKAIELDVQEMLNGVDLEGARKKTKTPEMKREAVRLFISYSRKDENLRNQLQTHIKLLQRQGIIDAWDDSQIDAGDERKQKIDENLERADIILLLVSAHFFADSCFENEMKRAMQRHNNNEARVIPIIVREVNWNKAPFAKLEALPKNGKPVKSWPDKDKAWSNVAEGIEKVAEQIRKRAGDGPAPVKR